MITNNYCAFHASKGPRWGPRASIQRQELGGGGGGRGRGAGVNKGRRKAEGEGDVKEQGDGWREGGKRLALTI